MKNGGMDYTRGYTPTGLAVARTVPVSGSSPNFSIFIRYIYYLFIFSIPIDVLTASYLGGSTISRGVGLFLVALTLSNPGAYYKRLPMPFWYFFVYMGLLVFFGLGAGISGGTLLSGAFSIGQLLALFLISFNLMRSERVVTSTLWALAISCTIVAGFQALGVATQVVADERVSIEGTNANYIASVLALGMLAIAGLAFGRTRSRLSARVVFVSFAVILSFQIVRTGSRGAAVALAIGLIAFVLREDTSLVSKVRLLAIISALLGVLVVASFQVEAVRTRWVNTIVEGDVAGRDRIFEHSWDMFLERPLTGWGYGVNTVELRDREGRGDLYLDTHNLYLWLLTEVGLLGTLPFLLGMWWCLRSAWRARSGAQGVLPLAMMLAMLALNLTGTYLGDKFLWLVMAYAGASGGYPHVLAPRNLPPATGRLWAGQTESSVVSDPGGW